MDKNDTERLNWLEQQEGSGLLSDDQGRWVFVKAEDWRPSIREAIDAAFAKEHAEELRDSIRHGPGSS